VVDGKIYLVGGGGSDGELITAVDVYDPKTDSWTTKADIPTGRKWLATSVVDGKIYAIGGVPGPDWGGELLATVEMYDPATDTWTTKADLPAARCLMAAITFDGLIYAIGGYVVRDDGEVAISGKVELYDPANNIWFPGKNL
jgi:N-acetylneuraminic acid mutarotase